MKPQQYWFYVHIEDRRINFGLENVVLLKIEIPELSLSPWCMLGPVRHRFCRVLLFSLFDGALDAYTHCTLGIVQPFKAESLSHKGLQLFRPVCSLLQCNTRACSPTRGIYYLEIVEDIICRKQEHHRTEETPSYFDIFLLKNGGV